MGKIKIFAGHADEIAARESGRPDTALAVGEAAERILRERGFHTVRNAVPPEEQITDAEAEDADVVLALEANTAGEATALLVEAYYSVFDRGPARSLAETVLRKLEMLGFRSRGAKSLTNAEGEDYFGLIRAVRLRAVAVKVTLTETPEEMLRPEETARALADAVAEAMPSGDTDAADNADLPALPSSQPDAPPSSQPDAPPSPAPVRQETAPARAARPNETMRAVQETLNERYGANLSADGMFGPDTKAALVLGLQSELNQQFQRGLATDGVFGPKTRAATVPLREGDKGNLVFLVQAALFAVGYRNSPPDGVFGPKTETVVKAFQNDHNISIDGVAGSVTQQPLFG